MAWSLFLKLVVGDAVDGLAAAPLVYVAAPLLLLGSAHLVAGVVATIALERLAVVAEVAALRKCCLAI